MRILWCIASIVVIIIAYLSLYSYNDPYYHMFQHAYSNDLVSMIKTIIGQHPTIFLGSSNAHTILNDTDALDTFIIKLLNDPSTNLTQSAVHVVCGLVDPNHGNTLMHWAAKNGSIDTMRWIIQVGCDINKPNNQGTTPLFWAATTRYSDDITNTDNNNNTPVRSYKLNDKSQDDDDDNDGGHDTTDNDTTTVPSHNIPPEVFESLPPILINPTIDFLMSHGALINHTNNRGDTALHQAVRFLSIPSVRSLLYHNADISILNRDGYSPLHYIPKDCHEDTHCGVIVILLAAAGADINLQNIYGRSPSDHLNAGAIRPLLRPEEEKRLEKIRLARMEASSKMPSSETPHSKTMTNKSSNTSSQHSEKVSQESTHASQQDTPSLQSQINKATKKRVKDII